MAFSSSGATRSLLEDLLFELARKLGWELPLINPRVHDIECDFGFAHLRLVVEADGYAYHSTRDASSPTTSGASPSRRWGGAWPR